MGGGKYRPPNLLIIFTGFFKHEINNISLGGDSGTSEPEAYCGVEHVFVLSRISQNAEENDSFY